MNNLQYIIIFNFFFLKLNPLRIQNLLGKSDINKKEAVSMVTWKKKGHVHIKYILYIYAKNVCLYKFYIDYKLYI